MDMLEERDASIIKKVKMTKLMMYTLRRPCLSEKQLHHNGKMEKLSMYKATLSVVMISEEPKMWDISFIAGMIVEEPTGGTAAPIATIQVMIHLVER
jgi:hypothetical protein